VIILGIDPGTAITGYGVVEARERRLQALDYGSITTPATLDLPQRLLELHRALSKIIGLWQPEGVAVEELFFNRNTRTAMAVGHARGVILLAAAQSGIPAWSYKPPEVKQAVVGYGKAEKRQVQEMIKLLLQLPVVPTPDDVADALAVAICGAHTLGTLNSRRG